MTSHHGATRRREQKPSTPSIENVWEYLRGNYLSISVRDTYDQILDACCRAWNAFVTDPQRVASVTSRDWAVID